MKLRGEKRHNAASRATDLMAVSETHPVIQFDPKEVLRPGDFELMTTGRKPHRRAMNLAVASLLFPERMNEPEVASMLKTMGDDFAVTRPDLNWTKDPEKMYLATGILKKFLPPELVRVYAEKKLDNKLKKIVLTGFALDMMELLGLKMLLPEKAEVIEQKLTEYRHFVDSWLKGYTLDPQTPDTARLELLSMVYLAFPDTREKFPLPQALFTRIKKGVNFSRTHEPAFDTHDIDSFPAVMLMATILGNPFARIDEQGNLIFTPPRKSRGEPSLPTRLAI